MRECYSILTWQSYTSIYIRGTISYTYALHKNPSTNTVHLMFKITNLKLALYIPTSSSNNVMTKLKSRAFFIGDKHSEWCRMVNSRARYLLDASIAAADNRLRTLRFWNQWKENANISHLGGKCVLFEYISEMNHGLKLH